MTKMPKLKTEKKIKTIKPAFEKSESIETSESEVVEPQDIVTLAKPSTSAKPRRKTKKKIKTIKPAFEKSESTQASENNVTEPQDAITRSKPSSTAKSRLKAKKKVKTIKPSLDKTKDAEMTEDEVVELQDMVLSKPDATAKPLLHTLWPVLLVSSILTCVGIPFIPSAERVLLGSFVLCSAIWSTYKIFKYEKDIHQWYIDNPEFAKKKKMRKSRKKARTPSGKPIMLKK